MPNHRAAREAAIPFCLLSLGYARGASGRGRWAKRELPGCPCRLHG
jgi:hypothetical protein